ncbi:MAG: zf-HC2 domain-containing protein [Phycisphaerae bacterium]|nr:zf-HC2 domain-containing protein [Phycisphaerae bacterium]
MLSQDEDQLGEQLSAYLDGELSEAEAAEVERLTASDPQVREMLDELRQTVAAVRSLPRRLAPEQLLADIADRIKHAQPPDGVREQASLAHPKRRPSRRLLAMAAIVIFAVGAGFWALTRMNLSVSSRRQQVVLREPEMPADSRQHAAKAAKPTRHKKGRGAPHTPHVTKGVTMETNEFEAVPESSAALGESLAVRQLSPPAEPLRPPASLETKLRCGIKPAEVLEHSFSDEAIRLSASFPNAQSREMTRDKMLEFMASRDIPSLRTDALADADPVPSSLTFFVEGESPANFPVAAGDRQLLVRMPAEQLDALVLETAASSPESLRLGIGEVMVELDSILGGVAGHSSPSGHPGQLVEFIEERSALADKSEAPASLHRRKRRRTTPSPRVSPGAQAEDSEDADDSAGRRRAKAEDGKRKNADARAEWARGEIITVVITLSVPQEEAEGKSGEPQQTPAAPSTRPATTQPGSGQ